MHTIIFYDGLSNDFVNKYTSEFVSFRKISDKNHGLTSMNDIRFMEYLDYLIENPKHKKVVITDAADVVFKTNVFDTMINDKLYVCYDRNRTLEHYYIKKLIDNAYGQNDKLNSISKNRIIQAGLFGGSMNKIIQLLTCMKKEFTFTNNKNNNNYVVFNYSAYSLMGKDLVFSSIGNDILTKCGKEIKTLTWK